MEHRIELDLAPDLTTTWNLQKPNKLSVRVVGVSDPPCTFEIKPDGMYVSARPGHDGEGGTGYDGQYTNEGLRLGYTTPYSDIGEARRVCAMHYVHRLYDAVLSENDEVEESTYNPTYYFDTQISCEYHGDVNRTFTKTTVDPCYAITWRFVDNETTYTGPLFISTDADAVKYTTEGTTYAAEGLFTYKNRVWYYSATNDFVSNTDGVDYQSNLDLLPDIYESVSDQIQACKDFIDLISPPPVMITTNLRPEIDLILAGDMCRVNLGDGTYRYYLVTSASSNQILEYVELGVW